jgi:hypothetical protein
MVSGFVIDTWKDIEIRSLAGIFIIMAQPAPINLLMDEARIQK